MCAQHTLSEQPSPPWLFPVNWSTCRSPTSFHTHRMSFNEAALAEPLAIALHSLRLSSIRPGETVAVIGAGPIGLLTIAALRAAQAGRIWAVEPLAHRRELARRIGADAVFEPEEAAQEILKATGQRGVDCAIDCAAGDIPPSSYSISPQCRSRCADRYSFNTAGLNGWVSNEAQGTHHFQCAQIEP